MAFVRRYARSRCAFGLTRRGQCYVMSERNGSNSSSETRRCACAARRTTSDFYRNSRRFTLNFFGLCFYAALFFSLFSSDFLGEIEIENANGGSGGGGVDCACRHWRKILCACACAIGRACVRSSDRLGALRTCTGRVCLQTLKPDLISQNRWTLIVTFLVCAYRRFFIEYLLDLLQICKRNSRLR